MEQKTVYFTTSEEMNIKNLMFITNGKIIINEKLYENTLKLI